MSDTSVARLVADDLARRADELALTWLDELMARLPERPRRIFPERSLLDHVPDLIRRIAASIADDDVEMVDAFVEHELQRLAHLRRSQGYTVEEVLEEFRLLERILFDAIEEGVAGHGPCEPREVVRLGRRVDRAYRTLEQVTSRAFANDSLHDQVERSELLSAFARAVAHELRNRLSRASMSGQLLADPRVLDDPERRPGVLQTLHEALNRLTSVADDVLVVALSEHRSALVEGRRQALPEVLRALADDVASFAGRYGVVIEWPAEVPVFQVDASRLELALLNVVGNAVKYRDDGQSVRWVQIRIEPVSGRTWRIDVADNGVGIPEATLERLFDRDFRGDAEGTRLGLAIAREAVRQLGGDIAVHSAVGVGTTFSITIPEPPEGLAEE